MVRATSTEAAIEVRDLEFRWHPHGPAVLQIAQFAVRRGERVFLQGASGSGKSTLLSLIGGVLDPERGDIRVLGRALHSMSRRARDAFRGDHIGFIFQLFNLVPYLTVLENVLLPCRFSAVRRARALERAGRLEDEAIRLLAHLDLAQTGILARPVTDLSVGQQQRVAAARALIGAPDLVIADEPTSSLDTDRRAAFIELLLAECGSQAITLLFVSHDSTLRGFFDRTVTLAELSVTAGVPSKAVTD